MNVSEHPFLLQIRVYRYDIVSKLCAAVLLVTAWLVYQKPTRNRDAS